MDDLVKRGKNLIETDSAKSSYTACYSATNEWIKVKCKGRALDIAPQVTNPRGAQVHGAHQAASHVPALYLPSCSRYSFTDPERMEG